MTHHLLGKIVFYNDSGRIRPAIVVKVENAYDVTLVVFPAPGPKFKATQGWREGQWQHPELVPIDQKTQKPVWLEQEKA